MYSLGFGHKTGDKTGDKIGLEMKHLHHIKGRYVVRVVVPENLRPVIGCGPELREWLGGDKKIAERNAPAVIARFYSQIDEAKATLALNGPSIKKAAQGHYTDELLADDHARYRPGYDVVAQLRAFSEPIYASRLRLMLADQLSLDEMNALIGFAADKAIAEGRVDPAIDRRTLLKSLAEIQLEVMNAVVSRDKGEPRPPEPVSPLLQDEEPEPEPAPTRRGKSNGKTLGEILKDFHTERKAGDGSLSARTLSEHIVAVRMLDEFLGASVPADTITKQDMLAYKRALMQLPTNYTQRFPGKTFPQAIKLNEALEEPFPTLNPQTINNKWLSHIGTIMGWAERNGFLQSNPARGVKVDEGKGFKEPTRVPFSPDDLKRIFGTDLFADPTKYESKQWALLIALYTGARSSSEVARIKLADIYKEQEVWVFDLIEATKNLHSKRLVPVHKTLIDLGLLEYAEALRKRGETLLFPDWQSKRQDEINRWFLRTYKKQVGIHDKRKVFHSFRHSLKSALARYGVNRDVSDLITGHKDQSVGGIYISDAALTMVNSMKDGIDRVEFDLGLPEIARKTVSN